MRELLEHRDLAALLIVARSSRDPDLAPFVGPVHLGESLLVVPRDGAPRLAFFTAMERAEAAASGFESLVIERRAGGREAPAEDSGAAAGWRHALTECAIPTGSVGLAGQYPAGVVAIASRALEAAGWRLVDCSRDLLRIRRRKTAEEIEEIRRVADAVCAAFHAVAEMLARSRPRARSGELVVGDRPLTAGRLRQEVSRELAAAGLDQPEGNIVSAGADAALPHTHGDSARVLCAGESLVVDLYPKGRLFADCTRTFCVGEPPRVVVEAHRLVRQALEGAARSARPGASATAIQEATCDFFEEAGWPTARGSVMAERGYVHGLGHGVGYELHELPAFRGKEDATLAVDDTFTIEPGLYDPRGGFGVRLEDLFLMAEAGPECLTPLPYDLDPSVW